MRFFGQILLKGLGAILPVSLTIYIVYSICVSVELLIRPIFLTVLPESYYRPGMGWLFAIAVLFLVGLIVNAWLIRHIFALGEAILAKIPLIKSLYSALRDFTEYFFNADKKNNESKKVVWVKLGEARVIGFVMRDSIKDIPGMCGVLSDVSEEDDLVAVYLPMSYQISGYTVYVKRSAIEPLNIPAEEAMRMVLTAGVSSKK